MKNLIFGLIAIVTMSTSTIFAQNCQISVSGNNPRWDKIDSKEVARLHNEYLIEALKISTENIKLSKKEVYMMLNFPTVSKEAKSCIFDNISNVTVEYMNSIIIKNFKNNKSSLIYNEILNTVSKSVNYNDLNKNLSIIRNNINLEVSGNDKDILLSCLETGLASSYVWYSREDGGSGLGYNYLSLNNISGSPQARTKVEKDLAGAGYGMVCWSFSAAFGPVGAAGFLYGAISGAVCSSFLP